MSTEQEHPHTPTEQRAGGQRTSDALAERAEERADLAEDRRRQRDLDDGEMGGES